MKSTNINPIFNSNKLPRDLDKGLEESDRLLSEQRPLEALQILFPLNKKYPENVDLLGILADTYSALGNDDAYLNTLLKLDKQVSNSELVKTGLADAYLRKEFQAHALYTYRMIHARWPHSENTKEIQSIIQHLEIFMAETAKKLDFNLESGLEFFLKHEEVQILTDQKKYKRCRQIAKEMLAQRPEFSPVRNNLSRISWLEGNLAEAINISRQVLEYDPENVHALSSLCIYYFLLGQKRKLPSLVQRLKEAKIQAADFWFKKIYTLCFIGEDDDVLELLELARAEKEFKHLDGTLWHWCAVAEYRKGNVIKARSYWKKCLKLAPYFSLATVNLEELAKPVFDRMCPQVFSLNTWLSDEVFDDLSSILDYHSAQKGKGEPDPSLNSFLSAHPEILQFIPSAITAGDALTREFALHIADISSDPKTLKALTKFALGKEGPDSLRLNTASILAKHGVLQTGKKVMLWSRGKHIHSLLMGFNITFEAKKTNKFKPNVIDLMENGYAELQSKNGCAAEKYFRKAIEIQPDEPSFYNNLAVALNLQGREDEVLALSEQIEKRFPDYFFGQINIARKAILRDDLDKARKILDKLMEKDELHITEFTALCSCQIDFLIADQNPESASSWLQMWKKVYPEDPSLQRFNDFSRVGKADAKFKEEYFTKSKTK